mmetsp:Transcript_29497/g.49819  ORF Transcript_29497/g.49819 Transcript_29497/m.49819 type:complete len:729 (-) Transcript_29497:387-2573(-)|eukprot:CAMPEP_0114429450 /NCGR_PEP_ID=MMETSP0103-20121206/9497_1 /TAXON_ID=37642 ORGANISM="Paraphysomonas imperforata, Strain PA2" /NCGR_SAMPLE_ID=MMETSP0103 /ASSEMBLY_ACC=CAM_ASM_000201 /LENGTH=728 /DNA_ID=CAMNT_0001598797 /DNA_START=106 /DNA_END=2292 /DNA_ORIENTATION=+
MRVLLVDAYEENKKGSHEFSIFHKIFVGLLRQTSSTVDNGVHDITVRRINCLSDLTLDWEHDIIPPDAASRAKEFDKYHLVCISGDMKFLPWEPFFFQTITLIHMCHLMNKPIMTCGGGAFAAIYATATQGSKFYILNSAIGGSIESLKQFPVYCPGTKENPCGYLDNETGDIYSYDVPTRSWKGRCNTGIYRNASTGMPSATRFRAPYKKITALKRDQNLPGTANDHDTIVVIRNQALQHFALRKCRSPNFVACAVSDWLLNVEGGLPLHTGLEILAEGPNGPALFGMKRAFHIALMVDESFSSETTRDIMLQYLKHVVPSISDQGSGQSLYDFLFDTNKGIGEKHKISRPMAESLCQIPTRSRVAGGGPERVEVPAAETFEVRIRKEEEITAQMTAILHSTRLNKKKEPDLYVCNPRNQNKSRLLKVIGQVYTNDTDKMEKIMITENDLDPQSGVEAYDQYGEAQSSPTSPGKTLRNQVYLNFGHLDIKAPPRAPTSARPRLMSSEPVMRDPGAEPDVDVKRPHTTASQPHVNRLNWEKKWLDLRPHSPFEKKQHVDEFGRKKAGYSQMTRRSSQHFLPVHQPRESGGEFKKKVVCKSDIDKKAYNNFAKFVDMDEVCVEEAYQGSYKGGFLTPYERERKEYNDAKMKFVGGEFRNFSGKASQIPLRKEGGIRIFGEYPANIGYHKDKVRNKPFLPAKNLYKFRRSQSTPVETPAFNEIPANFPRS